MKKLLQGFFILLFTLAIWQLLASVLNTPVFPGPVKTLWHFRQNFFIMPRHIAYSTLRIIISIAAALLIGIPLGIAIGYSPKLRRIFSPFLYLSYPIPKLALLPVIMLLFGLGETSKIIMIFLILFFPVTMDIAASVRSMNKELFQTMHAFGLKEPDIIKHVIFPGILPDILTSLKVSIGIALSILFFAENYGTQYGLGYFIMNSWQKMNYTDLYGGIFTLAILGFFIFLLLDFIEDKVTAWK